MTQTDQLLTEDEAVALLLQTMPELSLMSVPTVSVQKGGLLNHVLRIECGDRTWFLKQYLDKNVSSVFSPPAIPKADRAELAYRVQQMARQHCPDAVPNVWLDEASCTLIVEGVTNPKELIHCLEVGELCKSALIQVAQALAVLHQASLNSIEWNQELFRNAVFRDYKLDLQYTQIANQLGVSTATAIRGLAARYREQKHVILHGDPNSRNIILNQTTGGIGVIDFEQSHVGHPAYDLAYILSEVCISGLFHRRPDLGEVVVAFLDEYLRVFKAAQDIPGFYTDLAQHLGVQMIYRFLGPSKAAWTFYIPDSSDREAMVQAASTLCEQGCIDGSIGLEEAIAVLQASYNP